MSESYWKLLCNENYEKDMSFGKTGLIRLKLRKCGKLPMSGFWAYVTPNGEVSICKNGCKIATGSYVGSGKVMVSNEEYAII